MRFVQRQVGIGVGTLVLAVNVTLLSGYALGCHSLRHLIGGFPRPSRGRAGSEARV